MWPTRPSHPSRLLMPLRASKPRSFMVSSSHAGTRAPAGGQPHPFSISTSQGSANSCSSQTPHSRQTGGAMWSNTLAAHITPCAAAASILPQQQVTPLSLSLVSLTVSLAPNSTTTNLLLATPCSLLGCAQLIQAAVLAAQVGKECLGLQGVACHCRHQLVTRSIQGALRVDVLVQPLLEARGKCNMGSHSAQTE